MSHGSDLKDLDRRALGKLKRLNTPGTSAKVNQALMMERLTERCKAVLQSRGNLPREDLEYLVQKVEAMKDERLKACIADLIAWGDDERADLETFCAVALEVMKDSTPSRLREAAIRVEIRFHMTQGAKDAKV